MCIGGPRGLINRCVMVIFVCSKKAECSEESFENFYYVTVMGRTLSTAPSTDSAQCTHGMCSVEYNYIYIYMMLRIYRDVWMDVQLDIIRSNFHWLTN